MHFSFGLFAGKLIAEANFMKGLRDDENDDIGRND